VKLTASIIAASALLLAPFQPGRAESISRQMVRELTLSQYQERADNPTLAMHESGTSALILKQKASGACGTDPAWRDAVHRSAWFGRVAKCWRLASPQRVQICPIAGGRVGKQSCIDVDKEAFVAAPGTRF
jgi:hypothetical protein